MTTIPSSVTICITSCDRFDLLTRTLDSFRHFNGNGLTLLSEDSGSAAVIEAITTRYPDIRIFSGSERLGIMGSIDRLYAHVETPFIFHLEDDWEFDGPVLWETAVAILDERPDISQVCVRSIAEIKSKYRKSAEVLSIDGHSVEVMSRLAHPEFFGWSPNPGLVRTALYKKYAPFGRLQPDQMSALIKRESGTMAFLLPGVARHIGQDRNVTDPTMPARPKNRAGKWLRGIKKKLYYLGLRKEPF
jgi:hypothetical protein